MDPGAIPPSDSTPKPPVINYVLSFLLVGVAWGFTTPFIRRAAADFQARQEGKQQGGYAGRSGQTGRTGTRRERQGSEDDGEQEGDETELLSRHEDEESSSDENDGGHADGHDTNNDDPPRTYPTTQATTPRPAWMTPSSTSSSSGLTTYLITKTKHVIRTILNLLLTPAYSIPLIINLTGSIWFFLLVGQHGTPPFLPVLSLLIRGKSRGPS